ncbi:hypothetical protein CDAR_283501 [Caerostris darwini]|uniref:Uncharacterized protein n=1 Tax=Caerostris darwini TaxID=1538125 RepID=A0AAV4P8Q2_9ARAC|nr:hypothetical protein CDAR_283501 [Caerostris darwini]
MAQKERCVLGLENDLAYQLTKGVTEPRFRFIKEVINKLSLCSFVSVMWSQRKPKSSVLPHGDDGKGKLFSKCISNWFNLWGQG